MYMYMCIHNVSCNMCLLCLTHYSLRAQIQLFSKQSGSIPMSSIPSEQETSFIGGALNALKFQCAQRDSLSKLVL